MADDPLECWRKQKGNLGREGGLHARRRCDGSANCSATTEMKSFFYPLLQWGTSQSENAVIDSGESLSGRIT